MQKKDRLKPLTLYGLDLKEALHAMLSVDPRKVKHTKDELVEARPLPPRRAKKDKRDNA